MGGTARYVYKTLKLIRVQEKPLKIPYVLIHIIYYAQFVYKSWKKKHINAEYNLVWGLERKPHHCWVKHNLFLRLYHITALPQENHITAGMWIRICFWGFSQTWTKKSSTRKNLVKSPYLYKLHTLYNTMHNFYIWRWKETHTSPLHSSWFTT